MQRIRIGGVEVDLAKLSELEGGHALEARLLLKEAERLRDRNPLEFYRPNSLKHEAFHQSGVDGIGVRAFFGGNRSGKTTTTLVDDLIQMLPPELVPGHLMRYKAHTCPFYCRVMTPDLERTMKPVIHKKLQEWTPKALIPGGWGKHYNQQAGALYLECGCRFDFLSYEMSMDKFGGADLHRCHYDEEPPEAIREECLMRLVDYDGDEVFSMTPLKGMSWAHKGIAKRAAEPDFFVTFVSMRDNPNLSAKGIERKLHLLSPEQRKMREQGEFSNAHGFVYPEVRDWTVSRAPAATYAAAETIVGIDPGIRKAGVVYVAWDGERFCVYDAATLRDATVADYVRHLRERNRYYGLDESRISYVIDPAASARSLTNAESVESELNRLDIFPEHGQNDLDTGVLMIRRLGLAQNFVICDDLQEFVDQGAEYGLEEDAKGLLHPEKTGNEHAWDAARYAIGSRAWPDEELEDDLAAEIGARSAASEHDVAERAMRAQLQRAGAAGSLV